MPDTMGAIAHTPSLCDALMSHSSGFVTPRDSDMPGTTTTWSVSLWTPSCRSR